MDLFCYTPQEFEMLFSTYTLTAIDAIGEGIVIYGEEWVQPYQARYQRFIELGMSKVKCTMHIPMMDKYTPYLP